MAPPNSSSQTIRLPPVLAIGFAGHRKLENEAASRALILDLLKKQQAASPGIVYGVSSAASGGDLLFAECCAELGIPVRILLPAPAEQFREDFDDAGWLRAEHVLNNAMSVEVTQGGDSAEERYYQCSVETVQQSQLLVALWDGRPARGLPGTGETVSFARKLGHPVIWIDSVTGAVQKFNETAASQFLHDPELDFLNSLPDPGIELLTDSPKELTDAWFRKIDDAASTFAPQVRRLASIPIVYTAAAALFSGLALRGKFAGAWLGISAVMGITAAWLPAALKLTRRQALWARTRTAAEVCRSSLSLWNTPHVREVIRPETIPELSALLMSLKLLKMLDRSRTGRSLDEFKKSYRAERITGQVEYFQKHARKSSREARRYRIVGRICVGAAIALTAALSITGMGIPGIHALPATSWLKFASTALFQIATVSGAWLIVNDSRRRDERYQQMHDALIEWDTLFDSLQTWPAVLQVVDRIEQILLVELIEWKALMRNVRLPRK